MKIGCYYGYQKGKDNNTTVIRISKLHNYRLSNPLDIIVEPDDNGFIARTPDLPLYGFGDDQLEAIDILKKEIECLYNDLIKDDEFTEDWLRIKDFLKQIIIL